MKNNKKNHSLSKQHQTLLKMLGKAFARISHVFGYNARQVCAAFKEGYLEYVLEKNPDAKVVNLALCSGIDRRQVSEYLKNRAVPGWHRPTRLSLILSGLKWLGERNGNNRIPVYGDNNSLDALCRQYAAGCYTTTAVLQELVRRGNIRLEGEHIVLNDWLLISNEKSFNFMQTAIWSIETLTRTLDKNHHTLESAQRNFQRMLYSSQIPEYRVEQLHGEIMEKLTSYYREITALLEKAESNVRPGTFPVYGVSFYEFGRDSLSQESPSGSIRLVE